MAEHSGSHVISAIYKKIQLCGIRITHPFTVIPRVTIHSFFYPVELASTQETQLSPSGTLPKFHRNHREVQRWHSSVRVVRWEAAVRAHVGAPWKMSEDCSSHTPDPRLTPPHARSCMLTSGWRCPTPRWPPAPATTDMSLQCCQRGNSWLRHRGLAVSLAGQCVTCQFTGTEGRFHAGADSGWSCSRRAPAQVVGQVSAVVSCISIISIFRKCPLANHHSPNHRFIKMDDLQNLMVLHRLKLWSGKCHWLVAK